MKKKYLIVSLLAAATACIFAGCAAKAATGAELDKLGNFGFENSAHENGYLDLKLDDGFKVDGCLLYTSSCHAGGAGYLHRKINLRG